MRSHGFFAVTDALANHVGTDQTGHSGVDVNHGTASKVQRAVLPDQTGFGCHFSGHFGRSVGIGAHPEPHHVGNRQVAEGEPDDHEQQHGRELDALGKGTDDQRTGDACKRGLESGEHDFRNDHALAEGSGIGKRTGRVVPDALHKQPVKPADVGTAFGEGQAVAIHKPQHHDQAESHHDLHQHRQHVLAAHQATVEQSQTRDGHQNDQQGGDHHPGGVALVGYGSGSGLGGGRSSFSSGSGWGSSGFRSRCGHGGGRRSGCCGGRSRISGFHFGCRSGRCSGLGVDARPAKGQAEAQHQ